VTLYLGSHHATKRWWELGVPLCVSYRVLRERKRLPQARAPWILDSGAFSELKLHGRFTYSAAEYAAGIDRLASIGQMVWAAPMDWMCEPEMIVRTGLSVREHQERTVASYLELWPRVIPVIQGYGPRDYDRCIELYREAGVALDREPVVGLGSVCRRSKTREIIRLIRYLGDHGLCFHGFGLKGTSYRALRPMLASADSMAWSLAARMSGGDANSPQEAIAWRTKLLAA
jgi:hypothetical protein